MSREYIIISRDFFGDERAGYFDGKGWARDKRMAWPFSLRVAASECNAEHRFKDPLWPTTEIVDAADMPN